MKILTAAQMGEVDRLTTERFLLPSIILMENAGRSFTEELMKACPDLKRKRVAILCGRGNNGGDGFVVARYLALSGVAPEIFLFADSETLRGDARTNWQIAQAMGLPIHVISDIGASEAFPARDKEPDIIIDALFGTGLARPIGAEFLPVLNWVNSLSHRAFVASVDIPSGLMADSPNIPGPVVKADLTVTFSALKLAHVLPPASTFAGKVVRVDIGSPAVLFDHPEYRWNLTDPAHVKGVLPPRAAAAHKGTFGHVYVVAGSAGKSGAAFMAAMSALRAGAGLVTLWLPNGLRQSVAGKFPELMTEFLPETSEGTFARSGFDEIMARLPQSDALVLGPGMTTHPETRYLIKELTRRSPIPVVLDADGLNAFAPLEKPLINEDGQPVILTPHPGEMARLIGKSVSDVQSRRVENALNCAATYRFYVALKGERTLIASPDGDLFVNPTGNPGMATGGSGDILAGMTGRFAAAWKLAHPAKDSRKLLEYLASAVYLHGLAGDLAAEAGSMESLVATDLLTYLPEAFRKVLHS